MPRQKTKRLVLEAMEAMLEIQLGSVRQLLEREGDSEATEQRRKKRRKSLVDLSVDLLNERRAPLHVDTLVDLLRERHGRLTDRDALASALAKKARQGVLVERVAPGTFGLRKND